MVTLIQIMGGTSIIGLLLFLFLYRRDPVALLNGFVFDCELVLLMGTLICALSISKLSMLGGILLFILLLIAGIIAFGGIWIVIGYLLFNAVQVFKRESHSLQNMLSLLLGVGLLGQIVVLFVARDLYGSPLFIFIVGLMAIAEGWLALTAVCFITTSLLCRADRPRLRTDYIIVLGCGLMHGDQITPLLRGRVDAAIRFYKKACAKGYHPKLVFSGGQGADETISESEAMHTYAIGQGVLEEDTLMEKKSTTTLENFKFSKQIIEQDAAGKKYRCAYATSDYHVLRGRLLARKAGLLKAKGVGSHTARYYVTNAMIREYVAIMLNDKKKNFMGLAVIACGYVIVILVLAFAPRYY